MTTRPRWARRSGWLVGKAGGVVRLGEDCVAVEVGFDGLRRIVCASHAGALVDRLRLSAGHRRRRHQSAARKDGTFYPKARRACAASLCARSRRCGEGSYSAVAGLAGVALACGAVLPSQPPGGVGASLAAASGVAILKAPSAAAAAFTAAGSILAAMSSRLRAASASPCCAASENHSQAWPRSCGAPRPRA